MSAADAKFWKVRYISVSSFAKEETRWNVRKSESFAKIDG
jgi:hypothetical protein